MELHYKQHVFLAAGKMTHVDQIAQRIAHTRTRLEENLQELEERVQMSLGIAFSSRPFLSHGCCCCASPKAHV
jgi:hypothetical protein